MDITYFEVNIGNWKIVRNQRENWKYKNFKNSLRLRKRHCYIDGRDKMMVDFDGRDKETNKK